jgi:hypothetical protein
VGDGDGPWSAVNRQNNCCQHRLERQINDVEHVLNAPHDPDPISGGWWASGSDESSRGKITGQQWGGASDITIRSGNTQQSHQVGTSNDPRHPLHLQGLNEFPTAPTRPATQTGPHVRCVSPLYCSCNPCILMVVDQLVPIAVFQQLHP